MCVPQLCQDAGLSSPRIVIFVRQLLPWGYRGATSSTLADGGHGLSTVKEAVGLQLLGAG